MNIDKILTCDKLGETSKRLYYSRLKQWLEIVNAKANAKANTKASLPLDLAYIIQNPEIACQLLKDNIKTPSVATLHTYYSAIVAFLHHCDTLAPTPKELKEKWRRIQGENWELRPKYDGKPINEKQEIVANSLTWADVIKRRDMLEYGSIAHLLLSMYTYLPPVRADYYCVEIIGSTGTSTGTTMPTTCNYLTIDQEKGIMELHIGEFKTAKRYGEILHTIKKDEPLYKIIMESLRRSPRKYLFTMPSRPKEPFDRHGFIVWTSGLLRKIFENVPMSLTDFRHLHNSTIDYTNTPANQLEKLGKQMGHSMEMQKKYQWGNFISPPGPPGLSEGYTHQPSGLNKPEGVSRS
jgi:integrase